MAIRPYSGSAYETRPCAILAEESSSETKVLDLARRALECVPKDLGPFRCIVTLDLSYNNIAELSPGSLGCMPTLRNIRLRGNQITRLASEVLHGIRDLHSLDVSDNPITFLEVDGTVVNWEHWSKYLDELYAEGALFSHDVLYSIPPPDRGGEVATDDEVRFTFNNTPLSKKYKKDYKMWVCNGFKRCATLRLSAETAPS